MSLGVYCFWNQAVGLQFLRGSGSDRGGGVKGQVFFCLVLLMLLFSVDGSSGYVATTAVSDTDCSFFSKLDKF